MSRRWWVELGETLAAVVGEPGGLCVEWDGGFLEIGAVGAEQVTLPGENGMTIFADLDGDGVVDHVSMHHFDGRFEVWSALVGAGGWGLPVEEVEEVEDALPAWGLPAGTAPVKGWGVPDISHAERRWMRIDRG